MIADILIVVNPRSVEARMARKAGAALVEEAPGCCASVLAAPLDETQAADLAQAFAALADPVRLRLLSLIADAGRICACDLLEPLGKSQPTVSHHTRVLAEAGLITGEKQGRWVWWSIVPGRLDAVRQALGKR
jgi:ArsR family transcriptional regulator, arsenate/arsenite/antimonite-responsive transcriptional repressor